VADDGRHDHDVKIGAHVSTAGTLDKCLDRACEIGAEAIQIFASGPQSWRPSAHADDAIDTLRRRADECGIGPLFLHGIYLVNLASADPAMVGRSVGSLKQYMKFAARSGARGVIFHTGSHKGAGFDAVLPQIADAVERVLADTPDEACLILENSAGQGGSIGSKFSELGAIIRAVGSPRVKVCLDTCHCYAAGYDLKNPEGVAAAMDELDREVGLDRLVAVHANDCKAGLGSGLDRHENIGRGHLGEEGFRAIMSHPAFRDLPFILEVPGMNGGGPDKENIDILKRIAAEAGVE
jgi:deoxyribonuclease-4